MNRRAVLLLAVAAAVVIAALLTRGKGGSGTGKPRPAFRSTAAAPASATVRSGYDNFKLLHTRNIFDPDRRPIRTGPAPVATPPPSRADFVALTGTFLDGERKQLAFFTGSRPEYNKVLTVREQIAGATVNKITGLNVEVVRNGHPVTVAVGQTVPFDNSAPAAAPAPEVAAPAAPDPAPAAASGNPAPGAPAPLPAVAANAATAGGGPGPLPAAPNALSAGKQDDVRRRMEERRRQEQK